MTEQERQERVAKGQLWLDTEEFIAHQGKMKDLMYEFNMSRPSETARRAELMKQIFGTVGKDVWINQPLSLLVGTTVTIGDGTYANAGLTLIDDASITIGKGCLFGTNVTLCTTGHPIDPEERAKCSMYSFPITIGDGAWLGAGSIVLPGITIGKFADWRRKRGDKRHSRLYGRSRQSLPPHSQNQRTRQGILLAGQKV